MNVDFIIVGQGLAGTCFAFELIKQNKTFVIIDEHKTTTSSQIALGVYNPLILKWFTKPWKIDSQLKYFYIFYNEINNFLKNNFFDNTGIYKFLKTPYDQNNWLTKHTVSGRNIYMSSELYSISNKGLRNKEFYGFIKSAGRVNIKLLLNTFRTFCKTENQIIEEKFNHDKLIINTSSVSFKHITANNIIFCEGYNVIHNPYFKDLNLKPTKGEILNIYCKGLNVKEIIHSGLLFIPLGQDYYSIGATYNWEDINNKPTQEAKKKIITLLDSFLNRPYKIINQLAGIRPSTIDRRALIGSHTKHKNIYILNGLGTRGVLLAPYLSQVLINSIYFNKSIPKEVNINRI